MSIKNVICDMDGVIYRGKTLINGATTFLEHIKKTNTRFLFLTNNSEQSGFDLKRKLEAMGLHGVQEENFITSSIVTSLFLKNQKEGASIYAIGGAGLTSELYKAGFSLSENNPDYVVVGKTPNFNFEMLKKAIRLISAGAKFIATNPDVVDPTESGIEPACGALLAPIEKATGKKPYIVGKPNSLMMTIALKRLGPFPPAHGII